MGDFGLVRLGQHSNTVTMPTSTVLGTSAYMAPEAFRGDVSVKLDTFSFGVVSLQRLTRRHVTNLVYLVYNGFGTVLCLYL